MQVDVFSFAIIMYELLHKYMMIFAVSNKVGGRKGRGLL